MCDWHLSGDVTHVLQASMGFTKKLELEIGIVKIASECPKLKKTNVGWRCDAASWKKKALSSFGWVGQGFVYI